MTADGPVGSSGGNAASGTTGAAPLPAQVPAASPGAQRRKRRAVVLVPGWGLETRNVRRDWLVRSLELNDPMPVKEATDGAIPGESYRRLEPSPSSVGPERPVVDVYETHWADLAVADDHASPMRRFVQATVLMIYWIFNLWWLRVLRQAFRLPGDSLSQIRQACVLLGSIMFTGVVMLAWYATVLVALVRAGIPGLGQAGSTAKDESSTKTVPEAAATPGTTPGSTEADRGASGGTGDGVGTDHSSEEARNALVEALFSLLPDQAADYLGQIDALAGTELFSLLALTLAAFNLAGFIAIPRFVRAYLVSGIDRALHMEVHQRVQDTLDHVYEYRAEGETEPYYDEVVVVGHSLGAAIALEALAGWGNANVAGRTVLITWGGALTVLSARSPQRVGKMVQKACEGSVPRWIDVFSSGDWMSAELTPHTKAYPDATLKPDFPVAWWQGYSAGAHNQYYYHHQTLAMLLMPEISVKGLPD